MRMASFGGMSGVAAGVFGLGLVGVWVGGARGDVAFNNLGAADGYNSLSGFSISGPGAQYPISQGFRFIAATTGRVTKVVAPLMHYSGSNQFVLEIHADTPDPVGGPAGTVPGALLGEVAHVEASPFVGTPPFPPALQISSSGSVVLQGGVAYWLFARGLGTSDGTWFANANNATGARVALYLDGYMPTTIMELGAFRVEVTPAGSGCAADLDGNGHVEPADIALFVTTWYTSLLQGNTFGDFDHNGAVEPADVSAFVAAWVAGLSGGC